MNQAELLEALRRSRFAGDVDLLAAVMRPSLRLSPRLVEPADLPPGASRLAGAPDLPPGFDWPRFEGRPLDFLCQLALEEAQAAGPMEDLPASGWLLFFYDMYDGLKMPWGFDPTHRGRWRVLHCAAESGPLERRARPVEGATLDPGNFKLCALELRPEACLPDALDSLLPLSLDDDDDFDGYLRFLEETETTIEPFSANNRLLGHPALVQGDMREQCQLVANGVEGGCAENAADPRVQALLPGAKDWQLLLQIDTDEAGPGWDWGLGGKLYFWIRQDDLTAGRFGEVWTILQT